MREACAEVEYAYIFEVFDDVRQFLLELELEFGQLLKETRRSVDKQVTPFTVPHDPFEQSEYIEL
jgi:hypothetical protein